MGFAAHLAKSWMTKSGLAEADNLNGLETLAEQRLMNGNQKCGDDLTLDLISRNNVKKEKKKGRAGGRKFGALAMVSDLLW